MDMLCPLGAVIHGAVSIHGTAGRDLTDRETEADNREQRQLSHLRGAAGLRETSNF